MKIDYVHFYVKDAIADRDRFVNQMGFQALASGMSCHTSTTVVKSGAIYIVLSSPLAPTSPVARFLRYHPPGVADIAFAVSDLESVMNKAIGSGAKVLQPVKQQQYTLGSRKWGKISAGGSLSHTLSEYAGNSSLLSAFSDTDLLTQWFAASSSSSQTFTWDGSSTEWCLPNSNCELFAEIDHVVLNVAAGELEWTLGWYEDVLGFQRQQAFTIETDQSGLRSQVLVHPDSNVQFPINEPTSANSQIQEFLDFNRGSGVQHIALQTPGIVGAIAQLRQRGLSFLLIPPTYYTQLRQSYPQLPLSAAEFEEIAAQQILVDWQDTSSHCLLLQIFTQPIFEEPTFFFELIERRQKAQGFGEGNFRALFEAIEREQIKRGSLR